MTTRIPVFVYADDPISQAGIASQLRPRPEIARRLCYSDRTVKNIIHDVVTRLQLRNRSHAVAYALREGLI